MIQLYRKWSRIRRYGTATGMTLLLLIASYATTFAQSDGQVSVRGKVIDETGEGMVGVNVAIKGANRGTITDINGNYNLTAPQGSILIFSFIGYLEQQRTVGGGVIDVQMEVNVETLSEVIVIGYGESRVEEFTGSLEVIDSRKLEQIPTASFQDALQGNASGLQVTASDGAPGAAINVRVRGIGSISASNEPLYVIDGIPITSGSISQTDFSNGGRSSNVLASINPNDIENVVVLKDAASTAIYGSRGANGVILITTKSGKAGKSKIDVKTQVGFSDFAFNNILEPLNRDQYRQLFIEGYVNAGSNTEEGAIALYNSQFPEDANTNWLDEITQTGVTQQYDISTQGGTENLTYFVSGSYFNQEGTVINNFFERFSTRVNLTSKLSEKLTLTNNLNASYFVQRGITDGTRWQAPFYLSYLMAPSVPVLDDQGRYYGDHTFFMGANNPVGHLNEDERELQQSRIVDNLTISYEIVDNLIFKSAWSIDLLNVDEFIFNNGRFGDGRNVGGTANEAATDVINWLGTQTLSYTKTLGSDHTLEGLLGYEAQKTTQEAIEAAGEGFPHPDLKTLASAANPTTASTTRTEFSFNSIFSRINYDYQNKIFLSGSIRRDGSSRFGPENRWGTFWSLGAGYNIAEESFMKDMAFVDFLKFRVSYGATGNAGIGNFDYVGLYGFNVEYDGRPGAIPSQVSNPFLTWESQENFNIGFDGRFFSSRLSGSVEYFSRESTDLLLDRPLSLTTGFRDVTENVGDMRNSGVELSLSGDIISTSDMTLTVGGNITFLKNEVTKLPDPILEGTKRREEGRDFQEYYLFGWAGVDPANGDPLWYTDSTETETSNNINDAVRYYNDKSATPDFFGGLNINFSYKGFYFNTLFNYQIGNYVYDAPGWVIHGDGRFTPRSTSTWAFENRWTTPGQEALFPQHRWGGNQSSNTRNSSRYLYDGSFIRLKNVNLGYDFPLSVTSQLNVRSLRVYMSMSNIWTWVRDDNLHFDPEQTISGIYNTVTPISKTITFGVNLGL